MFKQGNVYYKLRAEAQAGDEHAANQLWVHFLQQVIQGDDRWVLSQEQPERSHHSQRRIDFLIKRFINEHASQGQLGILQVVLVAEGKKERATPGDITKLESQIFDACYRVLSEDKERDWVWALTYKGCEGRLWACHYDEVLLYPIYPNTNDYAEKSLYIDITDGFWERFLYIRDNPVPTLEMMQVGSGVATERSAIFTPSIGIFSQGPAYPGKPVYAEASSGRELVMGINYPSGNTPAVVSHPTVSTSSWATAMAGPSYTAYGEYSLCGGDASMEMDDSQLHHYGGSPSAPDIQDEPEPWSDLPKVSASDYEELRNVRLEQEGGKQMTRGTSTARHGKAIKLPLKYWGQAMIKTPDGRETVGYIAERTTSSAKYRTWSITQKDDGGSVEGKDKGKAKAGHR